MLSHAEQPLVSVCLLAYNHPEGLDKCLGYLCSQTYENLEIHVLDNASPSPDVQRIAKEWAQRDTRVAVHTQPTNVGIIANHRTASCLATGAYIMWACDDDWWHPDYIRSCVDALQQHPEAVLVFHQGHCPRLVNPPK